VISKPLSDRELRQAIAFAVAAKSDGAADLTPPERFHIFTMPPLANSRQPTM
jgi:hypothetical protein